MTGNRADHATGRGTVDEIVLFKGQAVRRLFAEYAPFADTKREQARQLGLNESTYRRLLKGQAVPSNPTIGSTYSYFRRHGVGFDELFQVRRVRS